MALVLAMLRRLSSTETGIQVSTCKACAPALEQSPCPPLQSFTFRSTLILCQDLMQALFTYYLIKTTCGAYDHITCILQMRTQRLKEGCRDKTFLEPSQAELQFEPRRRGFKIRVHVFCLGSLLMM